MHSDVGICRLEGRNVFRSCAQQLRVLVVCRWHAACEISTRNATAEVARVASFDRAEDKHAVQRFGELRLIFGPKLNSTRSRAPLSTTGHSVNLTHILPDGLERQHFIER